MKHFTDRPPAKGRKTAWKRKVSMGGALLTYTLFRRDERNAWHQTSLQYLPNAPRKMIASDLRKAWKRLRDSVDGLHREAA